MREKKMINNEKMHKFVSARFEEIEKDQTSLRTQAGKQRPVEDMRILKDPVEDPPNALTMMTNIESAKPAKWDLWKDVSEDQEYHEFEKKNK